MADIFTDLLDRTLRDLPHDANPWVAIRTALTGRVRPEAPQSFIAQLYTLSATTAVVTVILSACMFVKYRQGTLWLMRTHRATGGNYLVVHYSNGWTTAFLLFLGVLQGYIWQTIFYNQGKWVAHSDIWRMVVWIPGWTAFWLASWSLCVSHILHLDSSGRPARSFYAQAWFVNVGAIVVPSVAAVIIAVLAWQAHRRYWNSLEAYKAIDAALASYTGVFDLSIITTGRGGELVKQFTRSLSGFGDYFRWVFVTYLIATVLLQAVLCLTAYLHLRELRRTMQDLRARANVSAEAKAQEALIKHGYRSLLYVTCSIIAACTAINALFLFVAAAGPKVVYDRNYSEVASLLPLWLFAVLGLPLSILFLRRLLHASPAPVLRKGDDGIASPVVIDSQLPTSAKDVEGGDAYALEKLSALKYGDMKHAAASLDSDAADSLDTSAAGHSVVPLVTHTPPPSREPQAYYSSYSSRAPAA
ncbi:hypothetical protein BMF94_6551 [Rhodotorula taiwanensis]|uniref:Uncharacterized protein n=1 Tax=Rhodotorula taiwanensis TaxID=741276 RepID=A0A2S5B126_9BASI|nr:hypothetical protein BMF94_6551 [Rhodotorula taiwanensis]